MITTSQVIRKRKELRKKRRLILNYDSIYVGRYNIEYGYPPTEESFLGFLIGQHRGHGNHLVSSPTPSDITTFVLDGDSHSQTKRDSNLPWVAKASLNPPLVDVKYRDISQVLINETGKDALEIASSFLSSNNSEVFYSIRINDRHDSNRDKNQLSPLKQQLWDEDGLIHSGVINGLDYSNDRAYNSTLSLIEEVVNNPKYNLTGVNLDFYRHLGLFKNTYPRNPEYTLATSEAQKDRITQLVRDINEIVNTRNIERMQEGLEPLLIMVKAPDDVEYAKQCALDLETWFKEDLVDIYIPIGDHQINLVQDTIAWGNSLGVPVCPSLSVDFDFRTRGLDAKNRENQSGKVGRILTLLKASPDGMEFFNQHYGEDPSWYGPSGGLWRSLVDYNKLVSYTSRNYYVSMIARDPSNLDGGLFLPDYMPYPHKFPQLFDTYNPTPLNNTLVFYIEIYEEIELVTSCRIILYLSNNELPASVIFNGTELEKIVGTSGDAYGFNKNLLKQGINEIVIEPANSKINDLSILIR